MEEISDEDKPDSSKSSSSSPLVKRARKLLYRNLRVGVTDGRVFVGKFHCLDKQGNIILYDAVEYRQITKPSSSSPSTSDCMEHRSLGLILISARVRTSCHVECSLDEQMSILSLGEDWNFSEKIFCAIILLIFECLSRLNVGWRISWRFEHISLKLNPENRIVQSR